ncbi:hypothetical protein ACFSJS_26375 [Streptomyces desertarenae]|uniref:ANTAR domain-containing protein n=1 Tax=Streptomyces desertarenae TaxID=2666184 RepID=A0ABW4PSK9_9ACTN
MLSALINGRRKRPSERVLKDLHRQAVQHAERQGLPTPIPLDELEKLRKAVMEYSARPARLCASCPAAGPGPAIRHVQSTVTSAVLPVPLTEGDRQHSGTDAPVWSGLDGLAAHIGEGRAQDAVVILRYAGGAAAPQETAAALASCQSHGLEEAARDLLKYAAERVDRDVMSITKSLLDWQRPTLAVDLLGLALSN